MWKRISSLKLTIFFSKLSFQTSNSLIASILEMLIKNTVCLRIKLDVKRKHFFQLEDTLEINYSSLHYFTVKMNVIMKFCNFFIVGWLLLFIISFIYYVFLNNISL